MQSVGNRQKAILHMAKAKLGLTDEVYRDILMIHGGVNSSRDLDWAGYRRVMGHLGTLGFKPGRVGAPDGPRVGANDYSPLREGQARPGFASPRQVRMILGMWADLSFVPADQRKAALREFLRKRFGVHDLRFLTSAGAGKVINALVAMKSQGAGSKAPETGHHTNVL